MESEDDISPDPPLPDIPAQSRTLLHYFSKVKTEQIDKKPSQTNHRTKVSEKSKKKSDTTPSKSALSAKNTSNDIKPIVQNGLTLSEKPRRHKRKTKNNDIVEDIDDTPVSKKVRATIVTGDSIDENKKDESTIEKNSKGINSFFAAISKEEYRRESEKQAERVKLTVTAQVHTPELNAKVEKHAISKSVGIDETHCVTPTSQKPTEKLRNRRCSLTNVVRPTSETDTIKVVEQENILQTLSQNNNSEVKADSPEIQKDKGNKVKICYENTCSGEDEKTNNPDTSKNKTKRNQSKVSDKLFQRKKRKVNSFESGNSHKNTKVKTQEDSVDVDFFNMQMTMSNVEEVDEKENNENSLIISKLEASPEAIDFQPSPRKVRSKVIRTLSGDKGIKNHLLKLDREKVVENSLTSEKNSLGKKQTCENRNQKHSCKSDAGSIDCNESVAKSVPDNATEKTPTPVSLFKHKNPPKKKYNKKTKGTDKANAVNGTAHVNYDGDSIDLDLLATYNAKTFHSAASGELSTNAALDSSPDESKNAFAALMKKPIKQKISPLACISTAQNTCEKVGETLCEKESPALLKERLRPRKIQTSQIVEESSESDEKENKTKSVNKYSKKKKTQVQDHLSNNDKENMAPIFLIGKRKKNKVVEDPEKIAARKIFLQSALPESLRNLININKENETLLVSVFSADLCHIQQKDLVNPLWHLNSKPLPFREFETNRKINIVHNMSSAMIIKCLIKYDNITLDNSHLKQDTIHNTYGSIRLKAQDVYNIIKNLKSDQKFELIFNKLVSQNNQLDDFSTVFPIKKIVRRYIERKLDADSIESEALNSNLSLNEIEEKHLINSRKSKRKSHKRFNKSIGGKNSDLKNKSNLYSTNSSCSVDISYDPNKRSSMLWTQKYAPKLKDDVIGNSSTVERLQNWMEQLVLFDLDKRKNKIKKLNPISDSSDSDSDFSVTSEGTSVSESITDEERSRWIALLVGPNGVGKTATVYALAHEMGFKVLELNASSTRSGRQVLANLREATQSHSVKQEKSKEEGRQGFDCNKKSQNNYLSNATEAKSIDKTTVILFEDIDIVFEDLDEGFHNAINSLISTTKRPIVMTTSSQNFMACSKNKVLNIKCLPQIFEFRPIQPRIIAKYLQLLCLVEGFCINYDSLLGLTLINKGNISATIHQLQYWIGIYGSKLDGIDYNVFASNVMKVEYPINEPEPSLKPKPVEKEDSLAKLMSVDQAKQNSTLETFSLLHCSLSPIGMKYSDSLKRTLNGGENSPNFGMMKDDFLFKQLSVNFFEAFDWSRHILLRFHMTKIPKKKSRAIHYPLTATICNENSSTSVTKRVSDLAELKSSRSSYKRIKNNDSLFMTESDENITPDESELISDKKSNVEIDNDDGKTSAIKNDIHQQELQDKCTNGCSGSNDLPLNEHRIPKYQPSSADRFKSFESARNAMKTLSDYTDCISNFMPLQDDQPFWLRSNHKNSNCSSQLCANSNFYESYKKANNFQLSESYCFCNVDECLGHEQILAQEITANVIHLTLQKTQNSIQSILSKETDLLELSVQYPTTTSIGISNALHVRHHDKSSENLGTVFINEMDRKITAEHKEHPNQGTISKDLVCETASNKDFERGFDDNYVKQLHNAEREVLQSFFIDPIVNISRHFIQDALPVIREMARIEEHRKASGLGYSKKRTSRSKFLHYFETQNLYTLRSQTVLNTLCNSFQST